MQNIQDYHSFLRSLRLALNHKTFSEMPAITVVYGPCEYLREKAIGAIRGYVVDELRATQIGIELKEIPDTQWDELLVHRSLLEPKTAYIAKATDKLSGFLQFVDRLDADANTKFSSKMVLHVSQSELHKNARAKLEKANAAFVCCTAPRPNDEPKFAADLARKFGANLDLSAINLILQVVGLGNYYALENELRRLGLVFAERKSGEPVGAREVTPYLQLLKEEHIFQIDNLIINGQSAQAQLLLLDLMHRGEAPIAIVGIIARHCRNAIRVMSNMQGANSRGPNLPVSVLRSYTQYVRRKSLKHFTGVLSKCQLADVQLKTSAMDPGLLISELILDLGSPSAT